MPSALVASLVAPIRDVAAMVGPGWPAGADPAMVLATARDDLDRVRASAGAAWHAADNDWRGAAADAAREVSGTTVAAVQAAATSADRLGATTTSAAEAVARARARLQRIIDEFEARAAALEADLDTPGVEEELVDEARRSLAEAVAVVDELENELDGHVAQLTAGAEPTSGWPSAAPASVGLPSGAGIGPALGSALGAGLGSRTSSGGLGGMRSLNSLSDKSFDTNSRGSHATADPGMFGNGVAITLPDGSTATAPNEVAASAVRHALTQLGVPYHWGGTTPGVSLDCSGLTQWAYREAGLELPRLAQEQDVGAAVSRDALRPGDLAVWDGHVAMIVGNNEMIEAGDPVKLSPIRTTNAGQGFQGFWRPTA